MKLEQMDGRVAVITGGSSGVGLAVAKGLARLGAHTILLSRQEGNTKRAVEEVKHVTGSNTVEFALCDITDPVAVHRLIRDFELRFPRIDVMVSAAGSVGETGVTSAGIPRSFATNYLGHFLFVRAALPLMEKALDGRILIVGIAPVLIKRLKNIEYDVVDSKSPSTALMNQAVAWKLLLAHHLAITHPAKPSVNIFHPGLIRSNLLSGGNLALRSIGTVFNIFGKDRCVVAENLASSRSFSGITGQMFDDHSRIVRLPAIITNEHADRVWKASVSITERNS